MITINQLVNGTAFLDLMSEFKGLYYVRWGLIIPPDAVQSYTKLGLHPVSSDVKNLQGDRDCTHQNFVGALNFCDPSYCIVEDLEHTASTYTPSTFKYQQITYKPKPTDASKNIKATVWLQYMGGNGSLPVYEAFDMSKPSIYKSPGIKMTVESKWEWVNDVLIITSYMHKSYTKIGSSTVTHKYSRDYFAIRPSLPITTHSHYGMNIYVTDVESQSVKTYSDEPITGYPPLVLKRAVCSAELARDWKKIPTLTNFHLGELANRIDSLLPSVPDTMFGDLCGVAIQDAHALEINSIAYLKELINIKETFMSTIKLLTGRVTRKSLSKLYLSYKYGLRLTTLDTKEIIDYAKSQLLERKEYKYQYVRSMDALSTISNKTVINNCPIEAVYNYKIYYDPIDRQITSLYRKLVDLDLFPTFENIWDLIPYSFVVDWFVSFSELFDSIDTRNYINSLDVHSAIRTTKTTISNIPRSLINAYAFSTSSDCIVTGDLKYSLYKRVVDDSLVLPKPRLTIQNDFHNIAELTAIILAK